MLQFEPLKDEKQAVQEVVHLLVVTGQGSGVVQVVLVGHLEPYPCSKTQE
jgi:hypothetical protein